jgi:TPR repeat protein
VAPDSLALASQPVAKAPPAPAPEPENPGESQLILAWQYLEGQGGKPRDPRAASQFLWSAVEKGNLTAETTLANLYLRGEGVPKNCDQARVLLSAASDKGSAEAKRKLLELDHTGCH